ncbi:MAG: AsmA-like C-terminal region-containing protein [bacterium]|nr:AsmA-like C-terminal region-containing protein [bacterium]
MMIKYKNYIIVFVVIVVSFITACFVPINISKSIPLVEKQFVEDYGLDVHIDKLILRIGPMLKIKAPVMHVMYPDGKKIAQFNNVKFYVPLSAIFKKKIAPKILKSDKLIIRLNSDDKELDNLFERINNRDISDLPNICINNFEYSYLDKITHDTYKLEGSEFSLTKIVNFNSLKVSTKGDFSINNKHYINYDLLITPKLDIKQLNRKIELIKFAEHIKELDFHSDIIADLKLYSDNNVIQTSGFLNIDNISVLDATGKTPKSFIYLTLLGDKAGVLSNIYTNEDKKVYIEGMVKNTSKPMLDIKVRTDEIAIEDLYNKLKIFTDFSKLKSIDNISGSMSAKFNLKGDLNKIKSSGYLKITNAGVHANNININKINSNIDFSNNVVNITNAIGYVNEEPIMAKGKIDKNVNIEILMDKIDLKYILPASYGVKSGVASLVANITGTVKNLVHKENLKIDNLIVENNKNYLSVESLKIDTNKNNTAYISNLICKTPYAKLIKIPSLRLVINNDSLKIPETNIFMPNSKLTATGEVSNYYNNDTSFLLKFNGFVNSVDIEQLAAKSVRYPLKANISGNKSAQNINAQILLEQATVFDEPSVLNILSKFENNALKIEDLSVVSFSGKFSDNFKTNLKGMKKFVITGVVENLSSPQFKNIRIFTPQQLNLNLFESLIQLKGDVFVNGKLKTPEIVGQLQVQNILNQSAQLSAQNTLIDFNKNTISISTPLVKLAESSFGVNAVVDTNFEKSVNIKNLNIKAKYINTDTILMYNDALLNESHPVCVQDGKFYSEKILANIYNSPIYLTAASGNFSLKDNIIKMKNLTAELFNGKLNGMLEYNAGNETYTTSIMARGVSAAPIFNIVMAKNDSVSGTLDFDANVTGNLLTKKSLNGDIKFIAKNGRMATLGKLEHLLYAQNIVADNMLRTSLSVVLKAISLKDTGLFKYLRGDISIANGVANIKFLQSQGPLMALFIKGQYYTDSDYAKLVVLGRLSDEVISGLGAFGDFSINKLMIMLTGDENKYDISYEDYEKIPQLPIKNTKEFRSVINGIVDKTSSVVSFNWISYSQKSLKQKEVPMTDTKIPAFVEDLPY